MSSLSLQETFVFQTGPIDLGWLSRDGVQTRIRRQGKLMTDRHFFNVRPSFGPVDIWLHDLQKFVSNNMINKIYNRGSFHFCPKKIFSFKIRKNKRKDKHPTWQIRLFRVRIDYSFWWTPRKPFTHTSWGEIRGGNTTITLHLRPVEIINFGGGLTNLTNTNLGTLSYGSLEEILINLDLYNYTFLECNRYVLHIIQR